MKRREEKLGEVRLTAFHTRRTLITQLLTDLLELIGCPDQALETVFEMFCKI